MSFAAVPSPQLAPGSSVSATLHIFSIFRSCSSQPPGPRWAQSAHDPAGLQSPIDHPHGASLCVRSALGGETERAHSFFVSCLSGRVSCCRRFQDEHVAADAGHGVAAAPGANATQEASRSVLMSPSREASAAARGRHAVYAPSALSPTP